MILSFYGLVCVIIEMMDEKVLSFNPTKIRSATQNGRARVYKNPPELLHVFDLCRRRNPSDTTTRGAILLVGLLLE